MIGKRDSGRDVALHCAQHFCSAVHRAAVARILSSAPRHPGDLDGHQLIAFKDQSPKELVGLTGTMRSDGSTLSAVVIQGELEHEEPGGTDIKTMEPGSYFSSRGECAHQVSCERGDDCIIHARMEGRFDVVPVQPENVPVQPEN